LRQDQREEDFAAAVFRERSAAVRCGHYVFLSAAKRHADAVGTQKCLQSLHKPTTGADRAGSVCPLWTSRVSVPLHSGQAVLFGITAGRRKAAILGRRAK
jgi:hypothetical protein